MQLSAPGHSTPLAPFSVNLQQHAEHSPSAQTSAARRGSTASPSAQAGIPQDLGHNTVSSTSAPAGSPTKSEPASGLTGRARTPCSARPRRLIRRRQAPNRGDTASQVAGVGHRIEFRCSDPPPPEPAFWRSPDPIAHPKKGCVQGMNTVCTHNRQSDGLHAYAYRHPLRGLCSSFF